MLRSPRAFDGATRASHRPRPRNAAAGAAPAVELPERWSGVATLTRRRPVVIRVVRLDDRLHELVTYHITLVEVDERDAVDLADHFHRLNQAGDSATGQIDLRDVASHHRLGAEAQSRQEHLHLFGRRVLRL